MKPDFNPDDVRKVAGAIGSGIYVEEYSSKNERLACRHCNAKSGYDWDEDSKSRDAFVHKPDCVVLIARDLLT